MMADASCVAHAAGSNDNVKACQFRDGLAFVDRFGETQMRGAQQAIDVDVRVEARTMSSKYFGGANSERRVQKDQSGGDFTALHQIDDVDDQLLSAFDREGGDEQRAFGGRGVTKHDGKMLA